MSKIDEIKQALVAATPGPWEPAEPDNEETDGIILWAEVKDSPGSYTGVCEFHPDTFVKDEDVNLIAKSPEYIAYLLKQVEQQPELWDCPSCGFAFDACHEDVDPVTGEGNGNYTCPLCELIEVEQKQNQLRKALRDALKLMDKKHYGIAQKNLVEALAVGQEGEGNQ
ncbi:hypothetical protein [Paenibacillus illinoisensis]|uniref:hypothetical protein n=1 Tax=Paenibacillus illinoisensis TaxID=59845 RepID=UPI00301CE881